MKLLSFMFALVFLFVSVCTIPVFADSKPAVGKSTDYHSDFTKQLFPKIEKYINTIDGPLVDDKYTQKIVRNIAGIIIKDTNTFRVKLFYFPTVELMKFTSQNDQRVVHIIEIGLFLLDEKESIPGLPMSITINKRFLVRVDKKTKSLGT
jgi:hypothetical protein